MKSYLYLCQYNNYFNRQVKKAGDDLSSYNSYVVDHVSAANFDVADGISTTAVINTDKLGDYLLVIDSDSEPETSAEITSRWFVIEQKKVRGKQYQLTLRRDVIADNYDSVIKSTMYIEKGVIDNADSPLILNSESLALNQIKQSETLLKDKTKCPWLVAYLQKEFLGVSTQTGETGTITRSTDKDAYYDINSTIDDWEFSEYTADNPMIVASDLRFTTYVHVENSQGEPPFGIRVALDGSWTYFGAGARTTSLYADQAWPISRTAKPLAEAYNEFGLEELEDEADTITGWADTDKLEELKEICRIGLVRDTTGKIFEVSYVDLEQSDVSQDITAATSGNLYTNMTNIASNSGEITGTPNTKSFQVEAINASHISVSHKERTDLEATYDCSGVTLKTNNPLYDIICMPYGEVTIDFNGTTVTTNAQDNLEAIYDMARQMTSDNVMDLQLMPYCPLRGSIQDDGSIKVSDNGYFIPIKQGTTIVNGAIVSTNSDIEFDIDTSFELERDSTLKRSMTTGTLSTETGTVITSTISSLAVRAASIMPVGNYMGVIQAVAVNDNIYAATAGYTIKFTQQSGALILNLSKVGGFPIVQSITSIKVLGTYYHYYTDYTHTLAEDLKAENGCRMYRLCSPNYNGVYEFNLAKNGGSVESFNIDVSFKPYNPYIHVNPKFAKLYGKDFNDSRGLVCGGEFSLGIMDDAWNQYQIQNKNYQNLFDRQIQNLDVSQSIQKQQAGWQMAAGTLQGGATGAAAGASAGGPYGAIAGAVVGTATSAIGGAVDLANLNKEQTEARSYAIDNYNMQLGNVKALPNSITRTSALSANNKLYPFVEKYSCTDEEEEAFRNMITYDGMTVGIIATSLDEWVSGSASKWLKGQLIRNTELADDAHTMNVIAEELLKGVYI